MDLVVVILMDFLEKDLLGGFNICDVFSDTGSNQMVLEPTIRSFDLALGLGRKSMGNFDLTVLQHLLPLWGSLIGQKVVLSPDGVSPLDKSEDGMRIDIVGERKAIAKDDGLEGLDVSPTCLFLDQGGVKDEPAVIVQRRNEIPFLLGGGGPEMKRGVMLNQFARITG